MIHYHGTPLGGKVAERPQFLQGRHGLVSFYRPEDLVAVAEYCKSFVLDNGAFSHWKAGKGDIDFEAYAQWVKEYAAHPSFDWCLIPDKIDGNEKDNLDLVHKWVSRGYRAKGVPIWHLHESLDYLDYLVSNFEWIAFGSSGDYQTPNSKIWWCRMNQALAVACDKQGRPRCKLHGLRMLNVKVFTRIPFSSADSTNAAVNGGSIGRFGTYTPPTKAQRSNCIADRIEYHSSPPIWEHQDQIILNNDF